MSKLQLTDVEWGEFFIGGDEGLFDITSTSSGIDKNKLNITMGDVPYITRTDLQNGINLFITENQLSKYSKDEGNVITIGLDTQTVFYQGKPFYTGQNIQVLRNENLNKEIAMFIIPSIKIQMRKFNWGGNGATLGRLNRTRLILPIDSQGQPNWQFMENYIKQEQKIQTRKVIDYYERKLVELAGDVVGLNQVEWKTFKVKDVFEVKSVRGKSISNYKNGDTPYVTTSSLDNGLSHFISSEDRISIGKCISIDPIGGKAFFHDYNFVGRGGAGSAINLLYNDNLDEKVGLFICKMLESSSMNKASYGVQLNGNRLKNLSFLLPVDSNGNPNFQYMSDFVKKLELDKVQEVLEYIYIYIYIKLKTMLEEKVCEISWKDFWIEDVCEIKSGVRLTKANQEIGTRPFIGASDSDNGVTAFVSNTNKSLDENVLGVNYNGSVVENFYHPYQAIFSDDVKRVKWKDRNQGNKYTYLFLKQMILSQKIKYAYGYKFNGERMKRQKIMLPVTEAGLPDYDYMKSYMQKQELEQIFKILNYLKKEKK